MIDCHKAMVTCLHYKFTTGLSSVSYVFFPCIYSILEFSSRTKFLNMPPVQFFVFQFFLVYGRHKLLNFSSINLNLDQVHLRKLTYFARSCTHYFSAVRILTWHNWICIFFPGSRYPKAIEIFETIARHSMNNNLLKYSVRGILLNAGLCQLCRGDFVAITNSLERYQVSVGFVHVQIDD